MTVKIRPMVAEDKPAVMKILKETPEFKPAEVVVAEEVIDSYLKDPLGSGYYVMVADDDAETAGYTCYGPTPLTEGTWDLYWLAVASSNQGHGIGTSLMRMAEKAIEEGGGRLIMVETSSTPGYERARRLYCGLGYEIIARFPDFYTPGDDKVVFQKRLA